MAASAPSLYDLLGVERNAPVDEIQRAYRERAFAAHPDAPSGDAGRFVDLTEAYYTLSDEERREAYNNTQIRQPINADQARRIFDSILAEWSDWLASFLHNHEDNGSAWLFTGALGGFAFGATLGGPAGALVGAAVGFAGGMVRTTTNKSVLQHVTSFYELPEATRAQVLEQIAVMFRNTVQEGSGQATGGNNSRHVTGLKGLTTDEISRLPSSEGTDGGAECKVCLERSVALCNWPCQHACLCGPCYLQLQEQGPTAQCPICRAPISEVSRVFL